jgi:hypothetical protein
MDKTAFIFKGKGQELGFKIHMNILKGVDKGNMQ